MTPSGQQKSLVGWTVDRLIRWGEDWQIQFNTGKCPIIYLGRHGRSYDYTMGGTELESAEFEEVLGVMAQQTRT